LEIKERLFGKDSRIRPGKTMLCWSFTGCLKYKKLLNIFIEGLDFCLSKVVQYDDHDENGRF
jgi:hypothetical protein